MFVEIEASEEKHYTAWLTTDLDTLAGVCADVIVRRDELYAEWGEEERWVSTNVTVATVTTTVDVQNGSIDISARAQAQAEELLTAAGWRAVDDWNWEQVPTGYTATVEPANGEDGA